MLASSLDTFVGAVEVAAAAGGPVAGEEMSAQGIAPQDAEPTAQQQGIEADKMCACGNANRAAGAETAPTADGGSSRR